MIHKSDNRFFVTRLKWCGGYVSDDQITLFMRRETWWLFWIIPIYCRDTILDQ